MTTHASRPDRRHFLATLAALGMAGPAGAAWARPLAAGGSLDGAADRARLKVLHEFAESTAPEIGGARPSSGLIRASDGQIYGTCVWSGPNDGGTVYRVLDGGVIETVFGFSYALSGPVPGGKGPSGRLIEAEPGVLVGTTGEGGDLGYGVVYRLTLTGDQEVLHSFDGTDGRMPQGGVILADDGHYYGYTIYGGSHNGGTLYRMDALGSVTKLHDFHRYGQGPIAPSGALMQAADGNIYGCSARGGVTGGGTIFRIAPDGVLSIVHTFSGRDGAWPDCRLLQTDDGMLFGTARHGGIDNGGTIFRIAPDGGKKVLHRFDKYGDTGGYPTGGLTLGSDGALYGVTAGTWSRISGGIFRMAADRTVLGLHRFGSAVFPQGDLLEATEGALLGTTYGGGEFIRGFLYRLIDAKHPPAL